MCTERKGKKMKKKNKRLPIHNKIFTILLFISTIFMGIGYAATTSISLDILGTASVKKQDGVYITEAKYLNNTNAIIENSKVKNAYQTMLNTNIELSPIDPNSSITYSITLYNSTNETYYFQGVDYYENYSTYSNPNIIFTLNGININDSINSNETITFNITFSYKDNTIVENNTLESYLNFIFKKKYTITYDNLINTTDYPKDILEGETLVLNLEPSNPFAIHVYINGVLSEDYTYENKLLTITNISSNISIQGIGDHNYDVPVNDNDNNFIIVDSSDTGETVNVRDLFEMKFSGINGSTKVITKIELVVLYTSTTGSKQSIISTLTHNNVSQQQTLEFNGKTNNGNLTITFDDLSIGIYDVFTLTNSNNKLTNGSITIHSEELKIYFKDN